MDVPYDTVFGVVAPAGTPAAVIEKLNATINDGLRSPEVRELLAKIGIEPIIMTPREFADLIAREVPKWAAIVKATGVRVVE
jgi:tripartite-type tricarboxylate transporter receptor subunit TctC